MAYGRGETWFWRFVGVCALSVCTLNVMVLLGGNRQRNSVVNDAVIAENMQSTKSGVIKGKHEVTSQPSQAKTQPKTEKHGTTPKKPEGAPVTFVASQWKKPVWLDVLQVSNFFNPKDILLLGTKRSAKSNLVIGIPTVKRSKAYYLLDTLKGLIRGTSPLERTEIVVVIFIADKDQEYRKKVKSDIMNYFKEEVEKGVIQLIVAPDNFYPSLNALPPLYGDKAERVRWRSKQSLDYSFLYYYCSQLGNFYLQLEDDVRTEVGYYGKIKDYIASKSNVPWSTLEFGSRGFIGMMYKGEHLLHLARFTRMYFWTMPVDWIFRVFNDIFLHGNPKGTIRKPPLFLHMGAFSSLDGQVRKLEDIAAKEEVIVHSLDKKNNPRAVLTTSIKEFVKGHDISEPYGKGFFWGKTVRVGSFITVTFQDRVKLSRVAFLSGSPRFPADSLENGDVLVSTAIDCLRYEILFSFQNSADVDVQNIQVDEPIKCVQLRLSSVRLDDHQRARWLIIREIGVWTK